MGKKNKKEKEREENIRLMYEGIEEVSIIPHYHEVRIKFNNQSKIKLYDCAKIKDEDCKNGYYIRTSDHAMDNLVNCIFNNVIKQQTLFTVRDIVEKAVKECEEVIDHYVSFARMTDDDRQHITPDNEVMRECLSYVISYIGKTSSYLLLNADNIDEIQFAVRSCVEGKIYRRRKGIPEKKEA